MALRPLLLFLLAGFCQCPPLDVRAEINICPSPPDFRPFFAQVPDLGRRLRVACPCVGVHACGYACESMGVPIDSVNVYDLQAGYMETLTQHLQRAGQEIIRLNLGKISGDLLRKDLLQLETPVDFIVAGPPCPPWAGQGNRQGRKVIYIYVSVPGMA